MQLYWVSAIIQNEDNKKAWLCAMSEGEINQNKAIETINNLRKTYNVLSAWIDTFDENNVKQTVFHECYIDAFGNFNNKN